LGPSLRSKPNIRVWVRGYTALACPLSALLYRLTFLGVSPFVHPDKTSTKNNRKFMTGIEYVLALISVNMVSFPANTNKNLPQVNV
jgi:hypothetical protein